MKKRFTLFVVGVIFFSLALAFGSTNTANAQGLGQQCQVITGTLSAYRGTCRTVSGGCQTGEAPTSDAQIGTCVANQTDGALICCLPRPTNPTDCRTTNGGNICIASRDCGTAVPGATGCNSNAGEICCVPGSVRPNPTNPTYTSGAGMVISTNICTSNGGSCDASCWGVTGQQRIGVCSTGGECCARSNATAAQINRAHVNANIQDPNLRAQALAAVDRGVGDLTTVFGPNFGNYQLLEQIPGSSETVGRLDTYLQDIYRFAFWAVGIAVVFMLTIGGFMYLTSAGNTSRMESAKTVIFDAILGLVLALVAWLFLYVINPDLVNLNLRAVTITPIAAPAAAPAPAPAPTTTPGAPVPSGTNQTLAQQILAGGNGISLAGSGSCSSAAGTVSPALSMQQAASGAPVTRCHNGCPGNGQCTQATTLNSVMLTVMLQVARQYPYTVTSITGGSHTSSSHHYAGRAIDISTSNKADWPAIVAAFENAGANRGQTACDNNGTLLPSSRCNEANHIHVAF